MASWWGQVASCGVKKKNLIFSRGYIMGISKDNVVMIGQSKYGVELSEYPGSFALNKISKGQNDVLYNEWVFLSRFKNGAAVPDAQKRPMGIYLGKDKGAAIEVLKTLIGMLAGSEDTPDESDIPF